MKLLFICTHNACRSVLGEAITRDIARGRIEVASAGSSPAGRVHPLTLEYLRLHGYGTDGLSSKSIDDVRSFEPDVVVTVCDSAAREGCPVWLGRAIKVHWGLPDPSQNNVRDKTVAFAEVIGKIEQRIRHLMEQPLETMDAGQLAALLEAIGKQY
jgi:arsenate reductase